MMPANWKPEDASLATTSELGAILRVTLISYNRNNQLLLLVLLLCTKKLQKHPKKLLEKWKKK